MWPEMHFYAAYCSVVYDVKDGGKDCFTDNYKLFGCNSDTPKGRNHNLQTSCEKEFSFQLFFFAV